MRWSDNPDEVCVPDTSLRVAKAIIGLLVWSLGFVLTMYVIIQRHSNELRSPSMLRKFGYFYQGFEPNVWWWELLAKRFDTLGILMSTHMNIMYDVRGKLLLFTVFAGRLLVGSPR
eukprot:gnl/TRDRNA2_/TRDRNA2_102364_c0_seq1.p1 gnl/TRDRNA2_/TRDRNA2_102364_c0~~gnl/TRDRNA2_/TRDRNA2_102364_c0_seq1.p1  ORF type:complete len:116 (+),score=6.49 gnl/TRDRNA2_/TRDRNA2_102364_c0_seq1:166-513(+)